MSHKMKLGKPAKAVIGLATVWVAIYPVLFFFRLVERVFSSICFSAFCTPNRPVSGGLAALIDHPLVIILSILMYFALIGFYLGHSSGNTSTSVSARVIWGMGFIFLPIIAMPAYYLRYTLRA